METFSMFLYSYRNTRGSLRDREKISGKTSPEGEYSTYINSGGVKTHVIRLWISGNVYNLLLLLFHLCYTNSLKIKLLIVRGITVV